MINNKYDRFIEISKKIHALSTAAGMLSWDQEVYMPSNGAALRATQISTLSGMIHELYTSEEYVSIVSELKNESQLTDIQKCNINETYKSIEKSKKFSKEFVENLSKVISESFVAWHKAKEKSDFSLFQPHLEKLVKLNQEKATILGYKNHPYDALMDEYEPNLTVSFLDHLFSGVKNQLIDFVKPIIANSNIDDSFFVGNFPHELQKEFSTKLLKEMGYDFNSGRIDIASHPFCIGFYPLDTRITYRYKENDISEIIWSITHEGGHALYEQGLNPDFCGLPMGNAVSLSIHESQSRLWENNVTRSLEYWEYYLPILKSMFPNELVNVSPEQFFRACNKVTPSLIRTNADELTYHFHIMIRYEIEKGLIDGSILVKDLPQIWNMKYKEYLDIDVPNDKEGVLQDVHWSHGSFGYFPTYSLGSFYAAQFFHAAQQNISNLMSNISKGELIELRNWLKKEIHEHGMFYSSNDLCKKVTGEELNFDFFMNYVKEKYQSFV